MKTQSNPFRGRAGEIPGGTVRDPPQRAFTLVEMMGVLAIILVLALALVPVLLRQLEQTAKTIEAANLQQIAGGYRNFVLNNHQIPATATAFSNIATTLGWTVAQVSTNARGNPRVLLVDPAFVAGSKTSTNLPYVQGTYGATNLAGARVMFLTSMGPSLPAIITSPGTSASNVFNSIWNGADATNPPPPWDTSWGGKWADILVQRLNLLPCFVQVILNNASASASVGYMGRFSIDDTNSHVPVPGTNATAASFASYYFLRTELGLHTDTNTSPAAALQSLQILQDVSLLTNNSYCVNPSFYYDRGVWRGRLFTTASVNRKTGVDLQTAYDLFMAVANPKSGVPTPAQVTVDMYSYMSNYVAWAATNFPASGTFRTNLDLAYKALTNDSKNYLKYP